MTVPPPPWPAWGGSGTTTYAENIGVMTATKVYSPAAYWVAGLTVVVLSFCPKIGVAIATIPAGVLGGAATVLYGMIGMLGVRIWDENRVDFTHPANLMTAEVALIVGLADYTWTIGDASFAGHRARHVRGSRGLPRHALGHSPPRHGRRSARAHGLHRSPGRNSIR